MRVHVLLHGPCGGTEWAWRDLPARVVAALPHVGRVVATGFIVCSGGFIPPVEAHTPPTPYYGTPPEGAYTPPGTPIGGYPPAWGYTPPDTSYGGGGGGGSGGELVGGGTTYVSGRGPGGGTFSHPTLKQLCDTPPTVLPQPVIPPIVIPPSTPIVTPSVPEPGDTLLWATGLALLAVVLVRRRYGQSA